jgi:hypothetical protein
MESIDPMFRTKPPTMLRVIASPFHTKSINFGFVNNSFFEHQINQQPNRKKESNQKIISSNILLLVFHCLNKLDQSMNHHSPTPTQQRKDCFKD